MSDMRVRYALLVCRRLARKTSSPDDDKLKHIGHDKLKHIGHKENMMNRRPQFLVALTLVLMLGNLVSFGQDSYKPHDFDRADEADDLNRELWDFARKTPFADMLSYVEAAQRASQAKQTADVELPNGWRITPAGRQTEVGRLPYEAVQFAGRLVVLDTGYYFREPQEVSIVDIASGRAEEALKINSLFPSAVAGPDGDLYISGGFCQ